VHSYAEGVYDVRLTVSNGAGSDSLVQTGLVTVLPPPPTQTYLPVADARVKSTSPTSNYGDEDRLRVRSDSPSYDSYLRFDVNGVGSSSVVSARLRLFVTDGSPDGGTFYETASDWTELGITWDTAPGMGGTPLAVAGAVETGTWVELDVTPLVRGDGVYSIGLTSGSTNSAYYSSREGVNSPQLVVETGEATLPTADFAGSPATGTAPHSVSFTDLSLGGPTSWLWEFGDGATSTQQHPSHEYASAGSYTVTLTATNGVGSDTTAKTDYVVVDPPVPPVADFTADPVSGPAPLAVSFQDLSGGAPTSWLWEFGDRCTATPRASTTCGSRSRTGPAATRWCRRAW
jgi:PKD repeat protein